MPETFYLSLETPVSKFAGSVTGEFSGKNVDRSRKQFVAALEASAWKVSTTAPGVASEPATKTPATRRRAK